MRVDFTSKKTGVRQPFDTIFSLHWCSGRWWGSSSAAIALLLGGATAAQAQTYADALPPPPAVPTATFPQPPAYSPQSTYLPPLALPQSQSFSQPQSYFIQPTAYSQPQSFTQPQSFPQPASTVGLPPFQPEPTYLVPLVAASSAPLAASNYPQIGSSGPDVRLIQERLNALGYPIAVDGIFGPETDSAVQQFQAFNGLMVDGIVGPETRQALITGGVGRPVGSSNQLLKLGDTGPKVSQLQSRLSAMGYYNGPINGIFDQQTQLAVQQFQSANGLVPDGMVSVAAWTQLAQGMSSTLPTPLPTQPIYPPTGSSDQLLKLGDTGPQVSQLQSRLSALGYYRGPINGVFDQQTQLAVQQFQSANGLVPDGMVSVAAWTQLAQGGVGSVPTPLPAQPIYPPTGSSGQLLKLGDTGPQVSQLQSRLSAMGYYRGPINGIFDQQTQLAVQQFQSANGLVPDGMVSVTAWAQLFGGTVSPPNSGVTPPASTPSGSYTVVVPGSQAELSNLYARAVQMGVRQDMMQEKTARQGPYLSIGPFATYQEASQLNRYLRQGGMDARIFYQKP